LLERQNSFVDVSSVGSHEGSVNELKLGDRFTDAHVPIESIFEGALFSEFLRVARNSPLSPDEGRYAG